MLGRWVVKPESPWKRDRPSCIFFLGGFFVCKVIAEAVFHARLWPVWDWAKKGIQELGLLQNTGGDVKTSKRFIPVISNLVPCQCAVGSASSGLSSSIRVFSHLLKEKQIAIYYFRLNFASLQWSFHHAKSHPRNHLLNFKGICIGLLISFFFFLPPCLCVKHLVWRCFLRIWPARNCFVL